MNKYKRYIGERVELTLSGKNRIKGILIDTGSNIVVIYDGKDYLYVPLVHVQNLHFNCKDEEPIPEPTEFPMWSEEEDTISLRKILNNAKGIFTEIFVTSNQSIHGYVVNVMNDYFTFFSPVHKTLYIPLQHLKWLIPYNHQHRPYSLGSTELPLTPSNVPSSRTFEEQCKKHVGKVAVFDLGMHPYKIGKLVNIEDGQLEIIVARNQTIYLNIQHIKTVQFP
ncbi:DUF2642 domain-containing protein [Pseudalkalibacillus salsuginis]|uniref:DUF2642 domain-containing protein n=1 Tax=Pseudalkalibacillus salsuginis TaxID=2910972 RepID=UPI001F25DDF2|nr:DUF2642 domain-containing protein [Pseudalkalibacillus salsuginis]MCF6409416.1 DUF2642 domain-containing protein [Pseudalkalibacillus salsuginis]